MSTTRTISLTCDHATSSASRACEQTYAAEVEKVGDARSAAAVQGWAHKGGGDYCPLHVADVDSEAVSV